MTVITRFAPSPTGGLHIGSARTALFNYLFARHHGGIYKLRIEDTDKKRSTAEATKSLLDGLKWLGVAHDGEPIFQSTREMRHREVAEELVKRGQAYYCYTTADALKAQREAAEAKGEQFKYDRRWRDTSETHPAGVQPSIRIKAPLTGEVVVRDAVQGDVVFAADALDDFIILRSDGTPTYMHAVVVDDHDMGVTHIIRGDDHLNNAGRQSVIYTAMGWEIPVFAHIPLIHGADGAKLSKRHGATSTTEYADMGYLPEAMRNYLARLGWSHGDDEIFSDAQAIEWFTLEHVGVSPARLDFAKLNHVNAHYLRATPAEKLAEMIRQHLRPTLPNSPLEGESNRPYDSVGGNITNTSPHQNSEESFGSPSRGEQVALPMLMAKTSNNLLAHAVAGFNALPENLLPAIESVKSKASTLVELKAQLAFYLSAPTAYDEKAAAVLAKNGENIPLILPALEALAEPWSAERVKAAINEVATSTGKKIGELMPPLRAAIVGAMSGPDIPDAMAILGKAESLKRLKAALKA